MDLISATGMVVAVALSIVGPGMLVVRRLRWRPLEKLSAAVGLSVLMIYLAQWAIFTLGLPKQWSWAVMAAAAAATAVTAADLRRLWAHHATRRAVLAYAGLAAWLVLLQTLVRHYAGGNWFGDWMEHYQRTLFFIDRPDPHVRFLALYALPARPPLVNVMCAQYLSLGSDSFAVYQVVVTLLAALAVLPLQLMLGELTDRPSRWHRYAPWALAAVLAVCPMFVQSATYTWSRGLTHFLILLGVVLYVIGGRRDGGQHRVAGFIALAAAALAHYSAGPYIVVLAGHYLIGLRRQPRRATELATIVVICTAVLATWFVWSIRTYGAKTTFSSNTSVKDTAESTPYLHFIRTNRNVVSTLVPFPLLITIGSKSLPPSIAARVRNYLFLMYHTNLLLGMGCIGWLAVTCRLRRMLAEPTQISKTVRRFWVAFIVAIIYLGLFVHGKPGRHGLAHICLQPLMLMGLAVLVAGLPALSHRLRWALFAGWIIDVALGVALHFHLLRVHFAPIVSPEGLWLLEDPSRRLIGRWAADASSGIGFDAMVNGKLKLEMKLVFLGDLLEPVSDWLAAIAVVAAAAVLYVLYRLNLMISRTAFRGAA